MSSAALLVVNGFIKKSTEIDYDDLCILYQQFKDLNGHVPLMKECISKNNLPQQRIVNKILQYNNITYNDFINNFGKYSHVRADKNNYEKYVIKYKEITHSLGKVLSEKDLVNNSYGLPSSQWLYTNCPDDSVKTYSDFVQWCGFDPLCLKYDKQFVIDSLIRLQNELGRPIVKTDINKENVGFSSIVINRIWGSLTNCKQEIGLMKTMPTQPRPFEYYKNILDDVLNYYKENSTRKYISWKDLENNPLGLCLEHKTIKKAFERQGLDLYLYIKENGFLMNPNSVSYRYIFADGEKVASSFEYDLSNFLKVELNMIYQINYRRDVMYKNFLPCDSKKKINCDYVLDYNSDLFYIEVAGMISLNNGNWKDIKYSNNINEQYKEKMIIKEDLLESNDKNYLFLFPEDFIDDVYKNKVKKLLKLQ